MLMKHALMFCREHYPLQPIALGAQLAPTLWSAAADLETASARPAYWAGAVGFLNAHSDPNFRVEAVDSSGHWDAYYLPTAGIPIVRGWFRTRLSSRSSIMPGL